MKDGSAILGFIKVKALMVAVVGVVALLVTSPSLVSAQPFGGALTADVLLRDAEDGGVSGHATITDDGSGMVWVTGTAKGFDTGADDNYFSLFYDILSVSTGDGELCRPGDLDGQGFIDGDRAFLTSEEMGEESAPGIVNFPLVWSVNPAGHGSLTGTVPVGIDKIRTMSIRKCVQDTANCITGRNESDVVACGLIVVN